MKQFHCSGCLKKVLPSDIELIISDKVLAPKIAGLK